jgi:uncharacterized protein (TIRG00374 family)
VKNKLLMTLKIAVSVFSLYIVARSIDVLTITDVVSGIDFKFVVLAIIIFWVAQVISSLRCTYIANELGKELPLFSSAKAHFIGLWFNQVLPTSLGGDAVKVAILKEVTGFGVAIKAAILDRFSGLFLLMLSIAIALPLYAEIIPREQNILFDGLTLLSVGFIFSVVIIAWAATKVRIRLNNSATISNLHKLATDIWLFHKGQPLWRQIWTSSIVHLNGIAAYTLLGVAIGFDVNILTYMLVVPLVFLVALLPISFAGWGVREAGAVWLFGMVGMPKENALALSVAYGSMLIISGLPGLVWFVRGKCMELKS